jgi:hypothetical protein
MAKLTKHFVASLRCEGTAKCEDTGPHTTRTRDKFTDCGLFWTDIQIHPVRPSIVAPPLNIRLSDTRFASQFPTTLFLSSPEISARISISFPLFVARLADRRTSVTSLHHSATSEPPPSAEFASHTQTSTIGFLINSRKQDASVGS